MPATASRKHNPLDGEKMSDQEKAPENTPGGIGWRECLTTNPDAAIAFYSGLFGWTTDSMDMGGDIQYTMLLHNGVPFAGIMPITPEMGDVEPHWINYVLVEDAKAAEAKVVELGGTVHLPCTQIGDKGIMVVLTDPTGAKISLWQELG